MSGEPKAAAFEQGRQAVAANIQRRDDMYGFHQERQSTPELNPYFGAVRQPPQLVERLADLVLQLEVQDKVTRAGPPRWRLTPGITILFFVDYLIPRRHARSVIHSLESGCFGCKSPRFRSRRSDQNLQEPFPPAKAPSVNPPGVVD
jgi:hypothetical protein